MCGMRVQNPEQTLALAQGGDAGAFEALVAPHRRELQAHCYRMSGSLQDAEDLLQESLLRAWRGLARFEGRASLRTWLYRVTTNTCLDALDKRAPRVLPMDLGPAGEGGQPVAPPNPDLPWIEPAPDALWMDEAPSPEARYSTRQSVALAFLRLLQTLPPRQRAALLVRDVLGFSAAETAELLDLTVAATNSALQRARETMESKPTAAPSLARVDDSQKALVARYMRAWETADVHALVAVLTEDAVLAMPPIPTWLQGRQTIGHAVDAMVFAPAGVGGFRTVTALLNGMPGVAVYVRDPSGAYQPHSVHLLRVVAGAVAEVTAFQVPQLFGALGLAATL